MQGGDLVHMKTGRYLYCPHLCLLIISSEFCGSAFTKSSPKYASMAGGLIGVAAALPVAAVPVVGGIAATYLAAAKKAKENGDESFF